MAKIERKIILDILDLARYAPSGDNTQPWRFKINTDCSVSIYNVPERDTSLYNTNKKAALFAHGALIETIAIAATHWQLKTHITTYPPYDGDKIADVSFGIDTTLTEDPLFPMIKKRATNRKPFTSKPLTQREKDFLLNESGPTGYSDLKFIEDSENKAIVAEAFSMNEQILFENTHLHNFLFDHVRWSKEEVRKTLDGFSIKTFELPLPGKVMFKLASKENRLAFMNKIMHFSEIIPKQTAKNYKASAEIGVLVASKRSRESFLEGGRTIQRFWLATTKLGLGFQPLSGIIFLKHRILDQQGDKLSSKEQQIVEKAYHMLENAFETTGKYLVFGFRIGYGEEPSANTLRIPIEKLLIR